MRIGMSIFLIALGAILTFAVNVSTSAVGGTAINWDTVGVILMVVGILGLLWSLMLLNQWRDRDRDVVAGRETYVERPVERDTTIIR